MLGVHDRPREIDLLDLLLDERVIIASMSHAMKDDYVPALQLLHEGKVEIDPLITDRVPLERAVTDGFKPLVEHPEDHLKVLIDCR